MEHEPANALKSAIVAAYRAGLDAVDPVLTTAASIANLAIEGPTSVIAVGKAAPAMARGAATALGPLFRHGIVVSDRSEEVPVNAELLLGDHPFPGASSLAAGRAVLAAASASPAENTLIFLISGGGSSLVEVPSGRLTISDLAATAKALMNAGAPIGDLNLVRRHLSETKNGKLVDGSHVGQIVTLAISDVVDGPASDIASGPTLADGSTPADALAILAEYHVEASVPASVVGYLRDADVTPTRRTHTVKVIADGRQAARAAAAHLQGAGYEARHAEKPLTGDAVVQARSLCGASTEAVSIAAGETTMRVSGSGKGGRNQSAALAAALAIEGRGTVFAALATDGVDGPTDAAGAIVDGETARRIRAAGLSPEERLANDDAYPALASADALVLTGPTGTNVADLWFVTGVG